MEHLQLMVTTEKTGTDGKLKTRNSYKYNGSVKNGAFEQNL